MSALRDRMIEDMKLASLAQEPQRAYIRAVRQFATHYRKSPDQSMLSASPRGGQRDRISSMSQTGPTIVAFISWSPE
jgi:hypothetical protein